MQQAVRRNYAFIPYFARLVGAAPRGRKEVVGCGEVAERPNSNSRTGTT